MKTIKAILLAAFLSVSVGVMVSSAHHGFGALYDTLHETPFKQVKIVSVAWTNPHTRIAFDVTDEKTGKVTRWLTETGSPTSLKAMGWTIGTVKVGDVLDVEVNAARDGTPRGHLAKVTLRDGTVFDRTHVGDNDPVPPKK
jgi:hypothetical protein